MTRQLLFMMLIGLGPLPGCGGDGPERRTAPRGWYFAGSRLSDEEALGGFGPCDNFPKKCDQDTPGKPGQLSLIASADKLVDFRNRKAIALRLINRTDKRLEFSACDSSLYIIQEGLDSDGKWKPLEQFPDTFCGNSFHRVFLEANEYWEFFALDRQGKFKTKLRFRLESGGEPGIAAGRGSIYSNEYEGSIEKRAFLVE
jgi:hypothetical protein